MAALFTGLLLTGCTTVPRNVHDAAPLTYELMESHWQSPRCDRRNGCARVLHRYPRFAGNGEQALHAALQDWIGQRLADRVDGTRGADSPAVAARRFIEDHERETRGTQPGATHDWVDERRIGVIHQDARVVSLAAEHVSFSGGAHPMQFRRLASFDRRDGGILTTESVLRAGSEALLRDLLTRELRRSRELPADVDLADAGFFIDDNRVPLTDNFAVTGRGLLFRYDPYEIAPYAMGPVELLLAFDEVGSLLRGDGPAMPHQRPPIMRD